MEVSLIGGGESSGTVQVTYLGQTGVICDDHFDDRDAAVICRMLGYEGYVYLNVVANVFVWRHCFGFFGR